MHKRLMKFIGLNFFVLVFSGQVYGSGFPEFETPDFMHVTVVSDNMAFNGLQMKAYEFKSSKGIDDIKTFYNKLWNGKIKQSTAGPWDIITHYDGEFLYAVQIENDASAGNQAKGLLSVSDPETGKTAGRKGIGKGFPRPALTDVINDISATDLGKKSRTLVMTNNKSVKTNYDFYRDHYIRRGWVELVKQGKNTAGRIDGPMTLMFNKGGDEVNITFASAGRKTNVVAVLVEK